LSNHIGIGTHLARASVCIKLHLLPIICLSLIYRSFLSGVL